ncbi:L-dopachrome tautomerase-related protein [Burkholderia sp. 3C]
MNHRTRFAALTAALAVLTFGEHAVAADYGKLERWRSYNGVTWDTGTGTPFADSASAPIAGLHTDDRGRYFVTTPRWMSSRVPATLNLLDAGPTSGPARLTAFPSAAENALDAAPDTALRSVLGFYVDRTNGWLWALDMGYVAGESEAPAGGQKVVILDLQSGAEVRRIPLDAVADRKASFLNDIVVDEKRQVAYIADSGVRGNDAGLIVADLASGKVRRVLDRAAVVQPEPGAKVVSHGLEVLPGHPLNIGINGIALSADAGTLYWTVTSGTHLHQVPTAVLRDASADDARIAAQVKTIGDIGGSSDGIAIDKQGNVLVTNLTQNGIVKYDHRSHTTRLIASDDRIHWPDTLTDLPDGDFLFTASGLNEHFMGAIKAGNENYDIWHLPRKK